MKSSLAPHRLRAQRLVGEPLDSPAAVVGHLGAVQSQMPEMALWAIGRRCGATLAEVEESFARREFIRTHVLRPTWHDVLPGDLRDLLELTAPRIRQAAATHSRRDGLTPKRIQRWAQAAIDAIREHGPVTRAEVEEHLIAEAGFVRVGSSLSHVMIEAELTGEIHSGPVRGKQQTYVAADLPPSTRTPDERLGWLARTYGRGHGPFRDKDLAWWATLTLSQARRAIALAELQPVELASETHYLTEPLEDVSVPRALLLPAFDEFISYARDADDFSLVGGEVGMIMRTTGLLFVDGALNGSWTRSINAKHVAVDVAPTTPVPRAVSAAIEAESGRFGAFVERPVELTLHAHGSVAHK
ncbi:MAG TPA: winged helix DNA-binding domain-containing protein [Aeromicrobium sp.]|nr:winged helix DNA-binding domain-containing protein [Aeromicrobium sp.]